LLPDFNPQPFDSIPSLVKTAYKNKFLAHLTKTYTKLLISFELTANYCIITHYITLYYSELWDYFKRALKA